MKAVLILVVLFGLGCNGVAEEVFDDTCTIASGSYVCQMDLNTCGPESITEEHKMPQSLVLENQACGMSKLNAITGDENCYMSCSYKKLFTKDLYQVGIRCELQCPLKEGVDNFCDYKYSCMRK